MKLAASSTVLFLAVLIGALSGAALSGCKGKSEPAPSASAQPAPAPAPTTDRSAPPPRALETTDVRPEDIEWKPHTIEGLAVTFDTFANVDLRAGSTLSGTFVKQTLGPLSFAVQHGDQQTADSWRKAWTQYGPIAETKLQFCDAEALRLSVEKKPVVLGKGKSLPAPADVEEMRVQLAGEREVVAGKVVRPADGQSAGEVADESAGEVADKSAGEPVARRTEPGKPRPGGQATPGAHTRTIPGRTYTLVAFTHRGTPITIVWSVFAEQREAFAGIEKHFLDSFRCE